MVGKLVKRDDAMVLEAEGVEIEPEAIANSQGCVFVLDLIAQHRTKNVPQHKRRRRANAGKSKLRTVERDILYAKLLAIVGVNTSNDNRVAVNRKGILDDGILAAPTLLLPAHE